MGSDTIHILIVDDEAAVRNRLAGALAHELDIQVVGEAADGEAALEQAEERGPDLVLIDLVMPKMDGIAAIRRLTTEIPCVSVLALAGSPGDEEIYPAIRAGALGYLTKDCDSEQLVATIRRVFRSEPSLEPAIAGQLLYELAHPAHSESPTRDPLTARELEVLQLAAQGLSSEAIAGRLKITELAVHTHISNIFARLHSAGRTQTALYTQRDGLGVLDDVPDGG